MCGVCFFSKFVSSSFILTLILNTAAWQWKVSVWLKSRVSRIQALNNPTFVCPVEAVGLSSQLRLQRDALKCTGSEYASKQPLLHAPVIIYCCHRASRGSQNPSTHPRKVNSRLQPVGHRRDPAAARLPGAAGYDCKPYRRHSLCELLPPGSWQRSHLWAWPPVSRAPSKRSRGLRLIWPFVTFLNSSW